MNNLLDDIREAVRSFMAKVALFLNKVSNGKITPNMVTLTGLIAHIGIAWLIAKGDFILAGVFLIIFGLFDALDGQLARIQKVASNKGMVLDAVTDRMKEVMLYIGVAWYFVNYSDPTISIWAVAACGTSILVSYAKAKGETALQDSKLTANEKNRVFQDGLSRFEIRMTLLILGLFSGFVAESIMLITILSTFTAIQRLALIEKKL